MPTHRSTIGWAMALTAFASAGALAAELTSDLEAAYQNAETVDVLVTMQQQADLDECVDRAWGPRGHCVVDKLTAIADATQGPIKGIAEAAGLDYACHIAANDCDILGVPKAVAEALAAAPGVATIDVAETLHIPQPIEAPLAPQAFTWGVLDVKAPEFWETFGTKGAGVRVGSIDTGVDWDHDALIASWGCASADDPACWHDPTGICGSTPCDNNSHGTHTIGTMVGSDDTALPHQVGVAPGASFIACKGCEGSSCSSAALNACADWLLEPAGNPDNRPHVVNNSWGGGGGNTFYLSRVQAWIAAGIFPAFSAGNNGSGCNTLSSPGDYQETSAAAAHDSNRNIASFSSRGQSEFGDDPYTQPTISAPGVSVTSTTPGNSYGGKSGTSMASPHVAGSVALLYACNPSLRGDFDATIQALTANADAAPAGNCGAPPSGEGNYTYGQGYLNVLAAGELACGGAPGCDINGNGSYSFLDAILFFRQCSSEGGAGCDINENGEFEIRDLLAFIRTCQDA